VPYWALTEVFGRSPMYWHRLERSLGRNSLVGTTVSWAGRLPRHLAADEKHTTLAGKKVYLATTTGSGCCLGLALAKAAGNDELTEAYGVFRDEACLASIRFPGRRSLFFPDVSAGFYSVAGGVVRPFLACSTR